MKGKQEQDRLLEMIGTTIRSKNWSHTQLTLRVYSLASNRSVLYLCEAEQGMQEP